MNFWAFVGSYLEAVILWMRREKSLHAKHPDFFGILLLRMGFEHWEEGFGMGNGMEMDLAYPSAPRLQDPPSKGH